MAGRQRPVYTVRGTRGRSCRVTELDDGFERGSVKSNIMPYVKPWMSERRTLYCNLDKMADGLHDLHVKSSGAMLLGVAACAGGLLMNFFAERNKWENVGAVSKAVAVGGGLTIAAVELVQELNDFNALQSAKTEFEDHKETYCALKQEVKNANITDGPELDDSALSRPYSMAALGYRKKHEYIDTMERITTLLPEFGRIFELLPTFFRSWETMNGSKVPETVQRIRDLKEQLQELEDQLMVDLLSYFSQS